MGAHKFNPFAQGNIVNPGVVRDVFGRVLQVGDLVALNQPIGVLNFRVMKITPSVDPQLPPGMMRVDLVATVGFGAHGHQPTRELIRLLSAEEQGVQSTEPTPSPDAPVVTG